MLKFLQRFLKKRRRVNADEVYKINRLGDELVDLSHYPVKESLFDKGYYAYWLNFLVPESDANRAREVIATEYDLSDMPTFFATEQLNESGLAIHMAMRRELNGVVFEMVTNNARLLSKLDSLQMKFLDPWLALPYIDPERYYSWQGSFEWYWNKFWAPFWRSLNQSQRENYLANLSEEWKTFIQYHPAD